VYEKEVELFNQKLTAQRLQMGYAKNRFRADSAKQSAIDKIQDKLALELEALIGEKNKRIEAQNRITLARNMEVEKENGKVEERREKRKQQKKTMDSGHSSDKNHCLKIRQLLIVMGTGSIIFAPKFLTCAY
jgi:hypothetical protein